MVSSSSDEFDSVSDDEELVEEEVIEDEEEEEEEPEEEEAPEDEEEVVEEEIEEEEEVLEIEEVEDIEEEEVEEVEEEVEEVVEVEEEVEEVEEGNESDGGVEEVEKIVEKDVEVVGEVVREEEVEDVDMEIDDPDDDERRLGEEKKNGSRCGTFEQPNVILGKEDGKQAHGELQGLVDTLSKIDGGDARFKEKPSEQDESCLIYAGKSPLNEACGDHISHKGSDSFLADTVSIPSPSAEVRSSLGDNIRNGSINGVEEDSSSNFTMRMHPPKHFLIASMETSRKRSRSQTPVANHDNREEGSLCVYFGKGWCIKGNSCRFLHLKEGVVGIRDKPEGDLPGPGKKRQLQDEGPRPEIERSGLSASSDGLVFPTTGGHTNSKLLQKALVRTYGGDCNGISSQEFPNMEKFGNVRVSSPSINEYNKLLVQGELSRTSHNPSFKEKFGPLHELNETQSCGKNLIHKLYADERTPHNDATSRGSHLARNSMAPYNTAGSNHLRHSLLHYPLSESPNAAKLNVPGDFPPSTSPQMHFKPDAWEPSQPFRSSFLSLSTMISSPESQYDPLLDSFDTKTAVAGTSIISNVPVSLSLRKQQINSSIYQEEENIPICNAKITANSVFRANDRIPVDASEDASSGTAVTLGPPKGDRSNSVSKEERGSNQDGAVTTETGPVGGHSMESKAARIFHAVLVDYIKDLVKPFWRGGQLSKDAHKLVVKKAVQKVFDVLQPHQIPDSIESVNHYLSSSRPKLTKLVEAYVGKYSKARATKV